MADKYLLDTCALIYYLQDAPKRAIEIESFINRYEVFYSTINLWEIAIKTRRGTLKAPPIDTEFTQQLSTCFHGGLAVDDHHIVKLETVPFFENHIDPFDRLLIAQALSEGMTIVTSDRKFELYDSLKLQLV